MFPIRLLHCFPPVNEDERVLSSYPTYTCPSTCWCSLFSHNSNVPSCSKAQPKWVKCGHGHTHPFGTKYRTLSSCSAVPYHHSIFFALFLALIPSEGRGGLTGHRAGPWSRRNKYAVSNSTYLFFCRLVRRLSVQGSRTWT